MRDQDGRYQAYLDQLQSLDEFRQLYGERHPDLPVGQEDPAVSRIVESLAYFTVGTQLAAQNNMRTSLERLLGGYFDFMMSPMPAVSTLRLSNTERLVETTSLPEGVELALTAPNGNVGYFRSM